MAHSSYRLAFGILGGTLLLGACSVAKTETPALTGPSELSTSITISVSPDVLALDGASQSLVTITARDSNGQPQRNLSLRVQTTVNGAIVDFGSLSARNVVTDANGRAFVTYTAPGAPAILEDTGIVVKIEVVPSGTDFGNATSRFASIRLVPSGVIIPPSDLNPTFTATPSTPLEGESVFFDARLSSGSIASYLWDFGDGATASGPTATHTYPQKGRSTTYVVTLVVADAFGRSVGTTSQITVVPDPAVPSATFFFSPNPSQLNQPVHFNGTQSTAGAGHRIVSYTWNFGEGTVRTTTDPLIDFVYQSPRTYIVALTVTNDAGKTATTTVPVTPQ
jgi:PKD repeat protein